MSPKPPARRALGRGLAALIPQDTEEKGSGNEVVLIDVNSVKTNPFQPRIDFDDAEIKGLAESIKNQGLLQPILLRKKGTTYEIISGERRFRALKSLGNDKIPGIVKAQVSDREMMELALVENIQREDLNEIEKAIAYQRLLEELGYSHEQMSERVGKSRSSITNTLRLLKLPEDIQAMIRGNKISAGHARALLSIDNIDTQRELAKRIVDTGLTVRDIEQASQEAKGKIPVPQGSLVSHAATGKAGAGQSADKIPMPEKALDPDIQNLLEKMQYKLGTQISLKTQASGAGRIEIPFFSQEDRDRVLDILSQIK